MHTRLESWTERDIRLLSLFGAMTLSLLGAATSQFVLLFWLALSSDSVFTVALAGLAALLVLVAPHTYGERLALRHGYRPTVMVVYLVSAAGMLLLVMTCAQLDVWQVGIILSLRSLLISVEISAINIGLYTLAPVRLVRQAVKTNQTLQCFFLVSCAPICVLAGSLSLRAALAIDFVCSVLALLLLFFFHRPAAQAPSARRPVAPCATSVEDFDL